MNNVNNLRDPKVSEEKYMQKNHNWFRNDKISCCCCPI